MTTWDTADIAREFKVARKTVTDKWTKRPDFPKPRQRINQKIVRWAAEDVQAWAAKDSR